MKRQVRLGQISAVVFLVDHDIGEYLQRFGNDADGEQRADHQAQRRPFLCQQGEHGGDIYRADRQHDDVFGSEHMIFPLSFVHGQNITETGFCKWPGKKSPVNARLPPGESKCVPGEIRKGAMHIKKRRVFPASFNCMFFRWPVPLYWRFLSGMAQIIRMPMMPSQNT